MAWYDSNGRIMIPKVSVGDIVLIDRSRKPSNVPNKGIVIDEPKTDIFLVAIPHNGVYIERHRAMDLKIEGHKDLGELLDEVLGK